MNAPQGRSAFLSSVSLAWTLSKTLGCSLSTIAPLLNEDTHTCHAPHTAGGAMSGKGFCQFKGLGWETGPWAARGRGKGQTEGSFSGSWSPPDRGQPTLTSHF